MARPRRSTRLASAAESQNNAPASPTTKLESVAEASEPTPVKKTPAKRSKLPKSKSAKGKASKSRGADASPTPDETREVSDDEGHAPSSPCPRTPASSAIKPPETEMHPERFHPSTAAPSSALHLGFSDINPAGPLNSSPTVELAQRAATASSRRTSTVPSAPFTFHVENPTAVHSGLSERAKAIMHDIRDDIQKIAADLRAKKEQEKAEAGDRKIAAAKGKRGRFSDAHWKDLQKMDSIANHPSVQRFKAASSSNVGVDGQDGGPEKTTKGVKRTQSKANLNEAESRRPAAAAGPSSRPPVKFPSSPVKRPTALVAANHGDAPVPPTIKRARQRIEDDVSAARPVSRDASSIPRPTTSGKDGSSLPRSHTALSGLMTPTKSSLARSAASAAKAKISGPGGSIAPGGNLRSSASTNSLRPSASTNSLRPSASNSSLALASKLAAPVRSPTRFDRIKSMLRGHTTGTKNVSGGSALPVPAPAPATAATSKTPSSSRLDKELPTVPASTPSRKLMKRVVFTPDAKKPVAFVGDAQPTPSPLKSILKSSIPRSRLMGKLPDVQYPSLDTVMDQGEEAEAPAVQYPALPTSVGELSESSEDPKPEATAANIPGTFTFRSDHTIKFGDASPQGFGGSRGQSSVRHVRKSVLIAPSAVAMPGSFPDSVCESSAGNGGPSVPCDNKENRNLTAFLPAVKHGLVNKKRHRAGSDDEDEAHEEHVAKRQRQLPDAEALFAPTLMARGSASVPPKPRKKHPRVMLYSSPKKSSDMSGMESNASTPVKKSSISLSRLSMLARPKIRK